MGTWSVYPLLCSSHGLLSWTADNIGVRVFPILCFFATVADVIAVVTNTEELSSVTARSSGAQIMKRDLTVADDSGCSVRCTLWQAEVSRHLSLGVVCAAILET